MVKRFKPDELDELFIRFPVPLETMELIRQALKTPVRMVKGTTRNMVADLPDPKMGGISQGESLNVEATWINHHIFSDDTVLFATQPLVLDLRYQGKHGRTVQTTHVPDLLVCSATTGFWLEEYKPAEAVDELPQDRVGRYTIDYDGNLRSPPAEAAAQKLGLQYRIKLASEISRTRAQNQRELFVYLAKTAEQKYLPAAAEVTEVLKTDPMVSFDELAKRCAGGIDVVKFALAWGLACFDIDNRLISQPQEVTVFRDAHAMAAYKISIGQPPGPLPLQIYSREAFAVGNHFQVIGKRFRVQVNGLTEVIVVAEEEGGATQCFAHRDLELFVSVTSIPR